MAQKCFDVVVSKSWCGDNLYDQFFKTLEEAVEFCEERCIDKKIIRQFETNEDWEPDEEDEEDDFDFSREKWDFTNGTYPFGK
jgi:hypothetical protein